MSTMSILELVAITALVGYAVYKQTQTRVVSGRGRFRLAAIYAVIGGLFGVAMPHDGAAVGLLMASIVVSLIIGAARGAYTRVWRGPDGQIRSRGTVVTISLLLALIASKFGLGAVAYAFGIHDSSIGEILLMIGVSVAVQAEIVWRRAQQLAASTGPRAMPNWTTWVPR